MEQEKFTPISSLSEIFFRFFAGIWAGTSGAIVMGIVLFLTWSIVGDTLLPNQEIISEFDRINQDNSTHPMFLAIVLMSVFLSSLVSNLVFCLINSILTERYPYRSTMLTQVFLGNITILILFIPVYLIVSGGHGPLGVGVVAISHAVLAGLFTFFASEILSTSTYIFISLYGAILGLVFLLFTGSRLVSINPTVLSFLALPMLLGFLNAGNAIVEMFYFWFRKVYGINFLETDKRFGSDYGRTEYDDELEDI